MALLYPAGYDFGADSGRLSVYDNNTTTLASIYSDPELTTSLGNPITLDANGRTGNIYAADGARFTVSLQNSIATTIWTENDYFGWLEDVVNVSYTPSGGTPRTIQSKLDERVSVEDFGAVGDGSADDLLAIQAAIDKVEAAGGGTVHLAAKTYAISGTLYVDDYNVTIEGAGAVGLYGGGKANVRAAAATTLKFTGASGATTMLKFTANRNDDGTLYARYGGGVKGVFIDGQEAAGTGLELESWRNARFDDVCVGYVRDFGYKIWTLSNGVTAGASDSQHNTFINCTYIEQNTAQTPVGMILGSGETSGGNASFNTFYNLQLSMGDAANQSALELEDTDNNYFYGARLGGDLIFHADDTGQLGGVQTARYNTFYSVECVQEIRAKATVAGSTSSFSNYMYGVAESNGGSTIAIENNAELFYTTSDGFGRFESIDLSKEDNTSTITPAFILRKNSDVGEVNDGLAKIQWRMTNDAGTRNVDAGRMDAVIISPTAGSETARMNFTPMLNGSETLVQLAIQNGLIIQDGVTSVAMQGAGTINASVGYYIGNQPAVLSGSGTPEGSVTASVGALYCRTDGGANTTLYVKESGAGNTGWVAK